MKNKYEQLTRYTMNVAGLKPKDILFIRLGGSEAGGVSRRYSDYDVDVVKRGKNVREKFFLGTFNNRLVDFTVQDLKAFTKRSLASDLSPERFVMTKGSFKKAFVIYGDKRPFERIRKRVLAIGWPSEKMKKMYEENYGGMLEYFGKMLNAFGKGNERNVFFMSSQRLSEYLHWLVISINKIETNSENTMHEQGFAADIKPKGYKRDFLTLSGYLTTPRSEKATLEAAKRVLRWSRSYLSETYGPGNEFRERGFEELLKRKKI